MASLTERDAPGRERHAGPALLDPFAHALTDAGLKVKPVHAATAADVDALGSTWARKLGIPRVRRAWILLARKTV